LLLLLIAPSAWAAGGACPTGASYLNPANPTGSLVTLSSLGVTNCYFIAANGSDSNAGTTEAAPWLHAPEMPNCSSNCAAVDTSHTTNIAGTGFIFRGGDTWHFGNSGASPYTGGTWNIWWSGNTSCAYETGEGNCFYIGVDQAWYTGSSWARPVLNMD